MQHLHDHYIEIFAMKQANFAIDIGFLIMYTIHNGVSQQEREGVTHMIRVAIVGTGNIAHAHMEAYRQLSDRCCGPLSG